MRMVAAVVLLQRQLRSSTDTVGERRAGGDLRVERELCLGEALESPRFHRVEIDRSRAGDGVRRGVTLHRVLRCRTTRRKEENDRGAYASEIEMPVKGWWVGGWVKVVVEVRGKSKYTDGHGRGGDSLRWFPLGRGEWFGGSTMW